jgi:hypothetical protein
MQPCEILLPIKVKEMKNVMIRTGLIDMTMYHGDKPMWFHMGILAVRGLHHVEVPRISIVDTPYFVHRPACIRQIVL